VCNDSSSDQCYYNNNYTWDHDTFHDSFSLYALFDLSEDDEHSINENVSVFADDLFSTSEQDEVKRKNNMSVESVSKKLKMNDSQDE